MFPEIEKCKSVRSATFYMGVAHFTQHRSATYYNVGERHLPFVAFWPDLMMEVAAMFVVSVVVVLLRGLIELVELSVTVAHVAK